jgi:hypothetical protein
MVVSLFKALHSTNEWILTAINKSMKNFHVTLLNEMIVLCEDGSQGKNIIKEVKQKLFMRH